MKTTVDVPEALLVKAKMLAAEQRTTLRELVVDGLKRVTESRNEDTKKTRQSAMKRLLKEMQASNKVPMVPLKRHEIYER